MARRKTSDWSFLANKDVDVAILFSGRGSSVGEKVTRPFVYAGGTFVMMYCAESAERLVNRRRLSLL